MTPRLLVIAGSDSSAGAGLQADLKTAQHFGVYAQTAVTAVTVQDTMGVRCVHLVPPEIVRAQIEAALSDIGADAIKIGMLGSGAIAAAVADALKDVKLPLVLDPVMMAKGGAKLLDDDTVAAIRAHLLPLASLVTPNLPEANILLGFTPDIPAEIPRTMQAMRELGIAALLLKGGHGQSPDSVTDALLHPANAAIRVMVRQDSRHTHGTGCTLATAIACGLAKGVALDQAVQDAQDYVQQAIRSAPGLGQGHGPLNHKPA